MKRTKREDPVLLGAAKTTFVEKPAETRLRWRKTGGGSLRIILDGKKKIIKPGEVFLAHESELPVAFMDSLQCLASETEKQENKEVVEKLNAVPPIYELKEAEGTDDLWNVVNPEGKAINEEPLDIDAANDLLNSLS
jgi:hypothetical protein